MVWIIRTILFFILLSSYNLYSDELSYDEEIYFNFTDLDNDNQISLSEIEQSINIIFQIIDFNRDGFISKSEINELKSIVESLK